MFKLFKPNGHYIAKPIIRTLIYNHDIRTDHKSPCPVKIRILSKS